MKKFSLGKRISFVIVTLLILMVILEILLGIFFYFKDVPDQQQLIHVKNTMDAPYVYYKVDGGAAAAKVDSSENKSSNKYRVVIIGGSVANNLGNATRDGVSILQYYLNKELNTNCIEVINESVPGYVAEQEFILSQTHVQHTHPNLVFALDGYNDLMSMNINRFTDYEVIPPQNYTDFLVIRQGKMKNSFFDRFRPLFKNIDRFVVYAGKVLSHHKPTDYSDMTGEETTRLANMYTGVIKDTRDFYKAKDIKYIDILQPIKFYSKNDVSVKKDEILTNLNPIYKKIEDNLTQSDYASSLSSIFDNNKKVYTDNCHVTQEGNEIFAAEIAKTLSTTIRSDSAFQKLSQR